MFPKPKEGDYSPYIATYFTYLEGVETLDALRDNKQKIARLFQKLTPEQQNYRYAEGKWDAKEVLQHIIDTERVFQYRALTFARNAGAELTGFDQDEYVQNACAAGRTIESLVAEYEAVRESTIALVLGFDASVWHNTGTANGTKISVAAAIGTIAGHELHHYNVYKKRYL
jgi:DinB superfamily